MSAATLRYISKLRHQNAQHRTTNEPIYPSVIEYYSVKLDFVPLNLKAQLEAPLQTQAVYLAHKGMAINKRYA